MGLGPRCAPAAGTQAPGDGRGEGAELPRGASSIPERTHWEITSLIRAQSKALCMAGTRRKGREAVPGHTGKLRHAAGPSGLFLATQLPWQIGQKPQGCSTLRLAPLLQVTEAPGDLSPVPSHPGLERMRQDQGPSPVPCPVPVAQGLGHVCHLVARPRWHSTAPAETNTRIPVPQKRGSSHRVVQCHGQQDSGSAVKPQLTGQKLLLHHQEQGSGLRPPFCAHCGHRGERSRLRRLKHKRGGGRRELFELFTTQL